MVNFTELSDSCRSNRGRNALSTVLEACGLYEAQPSANEVFEMVKDNLSRRDTSRTEMAATERAGERLFGVEEYGSLRRTSFKGYKDTKNPEASEDVSRFFGQERI